ncbi:MAG: tRNA (N(6)-L-threonylcarbamoyladenosine(37)-C(2))-methylthiotransferase [Nanoarchaeota archaeon]|nr:tRNA (N(6)-L-threonylcarbamoyladenosine(37)-C(2))-methylthiotransferase [Nanoarchaeota archaeon]
MYNVHIETYGCSANQNNSEIMAGLLSRTGFNIVMNLENADIIILNSCIVKGPTMQKIIYRIKELSDSKNAEKAKLSGRPETSKVSKPKLIIAGCMTDVMAKRIGLLNPNASILGSHNVHDIVTVAKKLIEGKRVVEIKKDHEVHLCKPKIYSKKIIGITQISEGCVGDCSFCIVRAAKGPLYSYPQDEILKNVKQDLEAGCKEIWITSQDCSAYGLDDSKKSQLPPLLKEILKIKGKFKLRLGMSNPNHILPILKDLIEIYKDEKIFKFLHIPLQSGSDSVLESMSRHYKSNDFVKIIEEFRKAIPEITISTDIIVGYPTETEKDFEETLEVMKKTLPDIINISRFWSMPGTKASNLQQLHPDELRRRAIVMTNLHNGIAIEKNKEYVGKDFPCIVDEKSFDDFWIARLDNYKQVMIKSKDKLLGQIVNVHIFDANNHYLFGNIVEGVNEK